MKFYGSSFVSLSVDKSVTNKRDAGPFGSPGDLLKYIFIKFST